MRTYSVCTGHEGRPVSEPRPFRSEELDAAFTAAVAKCRVLTRADAAHFVEKGFVEKGYVVVKAAFAKEIARLVCETAWRELNSQAGKTAGTSGTSWTPRSRACSPCPSIPTSCRRAAARSSPPTRSGRSRDCWPSVLPACTRMAFKPTPDQLGDEARVGATLADVPSFDFRSTGSPIPSPARLRFLRTRWRATPLRRPVPTRTRPSGIPNPARLRFLRTRWRATPLRRPVPTRTRPSGNRHGRRRALRAR